MTPKLPKTVAFIRLDPVPGHRLPYYRKGGGVLRTIRGARDRAQGLKKDGYRPRVFEGTITWREVPLADDVTIDEGPLP